MSAQLDLWTGEEPKKPRIRTVKIRLVRNRQAVYQVTKEHWDSIYKHQMDKGNPKWEVCPPQTWAIGVEFK